MASYRFFSIRRFFFILVQVEKVRHPFCGDIRVRPDEPAQRPLPLSPGYNSITVTFIQTSVRGRKPDLVNVFYYFCECRINPF